MNSDEIFGLPNLGNTCFMNSSIQALLACTEVVNEIRSRDVRGDLNKRVFRVIFSKKGLGSQARNVCELLMHMYAKYNIDYEIGRQEDCTEYLMYLLDNIETTKHELMVSETSVWHRQNDRDEVRLLPTNSLSLPIVSVDGKVLKTFKECIKECFSSYDVDEDISHSKKIISTGKHLFVDLKRFAVKMVRGRGVQYKLKHEVEMTETIILTVGGNKINYNLVAMILHEGECGGGHYTCFRKINDTWYYFNDESVTELDSPYYNVGEDENGDAILESIFLSGYFYVYEKGLPCTQAEIDQYEIEDELGL